MNVNQMKDHLLPIIKRMPGYIKLAGALYKDPALTTGHKAILAAGLFYTVSPVDLVPGFIPVAGQLDDILVGLGAIKKALKSLPPDRIAVYEEQYFITLADIDHDLAAARKVSLSLLGKSMLYSAKALHWAGKSGFKLVKGLIKK